MGKINPSSLVSTGYQIALYCYPAVPLAEKKGSAKKNTLGYVEYQAQSTELLLYLQKEILNIHKYTSKNELKLIVKRRFSQFGIRIFEYCNLIFKLNKSILFNYEFVGCNNSFRDNENFYVTLALLNHLHALAEP